MKGEVNRNHTPSECDSKPQTGEEGLGEQRSVPSPEVV